MGNFTLTNFEKVSVGGANTAWLADLTMSSSYATGGDSFVGASLPFTYIDSLFNPQVINAAGYALDFDQTTQKVLAYSVDSGGGTPVGTNSASAVTIGGTALTSVIGPFDGTTAGTTTTIISGGAVIAENALAGGVITDGTTETVILSNTALKATSGTITTVIGLAAVITATGFAYQLSGVAAAQKFSGSAGAGGAVALTEVSAAVDLSALTVRVIVFGREV